MQELKILITAHELSPRLGSECKYAWNVLKKLSYMHELIIICNSSNQFKTNDYKTEIEKQKSDFCMKTKFIFLKNPSISDHISRANKILFGKKSNIGNNFYIFSIRFWEKSVFQYIKKII